MSTLQVAPVETRPDDPERQVVNDFSIQVATVNGSGSQTANSVLMRSIFQMGIPVSGKNMFPSNIAGLPTWFTIRASKQGFIARKKEIDFLVAMNPETAHEDVMKLGSGAVVVYDEPLKLNALRTDLHFYPVPFDKLVGPVCPDAKLRKLVKNMIYDGILAQILSIDMEEMRKALFKQFGKRKAKAAELNMGALAAGYDYAVEKAGSTKGWSFTIYEEEWNYGFPQEMEHFVDCVQNDKQPLVTGEDGRAVLEVIFAAYESARTGRKVELPFKTDAKKPHDLWKTKR